MAFFPLALCKQKSCAALYKYESLATGNQIGKVFMPH